MKKTFKTRIQDPENFGLFFNCLVRRYQWDFDEELLDLMIRVLDHYLLYFSRRTLICAIRDLADCHRVFYKETRVDVPEEQRERYDFTLKRMVKRFLSIESYGCTDE